MKYDIEFDLKDIIFKSRANGIVIRDKKVLVVEINNNGFFCLPGGHVCVGEDSRTAVKREFFEETGINCKVDKLVALAENFFKKENGIDMHEISYYYLLDVIGEYEYKEEYTIIEDDNGKNVELHFKWIDIDNIDKYNFKPQELKQQLKDIDNLNCFKHYIIN